MAHPLPTLAITLGEPSGIGPDIVLSLAQRWQFPAKLVVIGSQATLVARAEVLGLSTQILPYCPERNLPCHPKTVYCLDVPLSEPVKIGELNSSNAQAVLHSLDRAIDGALQNEFAAVITAPMHKGVINDAGIHFTGHTEYFADRTHTPKVVMMLAADLFRVALTTTHLPLKDVADAITPETLTEVLQILHKSLQKDFGIAQPKILVAGLNPHAGENGYLGREEIEVISPVLDMLRAQGMDLIGPLPADTLFQPHYLDHADAVLAMYHDQGLPTLKYAGFGRAINITLGLPIIRTSVDHGTALDIAGTGKASDTSLEAAISQALQMAQSRINTEK